MPYKCSIYGCRKKYRKTLKEIEHQNVDDDDDDAHLFRFPDDIKERDKWIKALPNADFTWTENKRICEKHWEEGYPRRTVKNGTEVPTIPPSVFENVPSSCIPTPQPEERRTSNSSGSRDRKLQKSTVTLKFNTIYNKILTNFKESFALSKNDIRILLTSENYNGPVSEYTIFISKTETDGHYSIQGYKGLLTVKIPFIQNDIVSMWSEIENSIHYIVNYEVDEDSRSQKEAFLTRQFILLNKCINEQFSCEDVSFALSMYSKSRTVYTDLLKCITMPSTRTLRRITNKIDNVSDQEFLKGITSNLTPDQMNCFILLDEVYVKPGYQYCAGIMHGAAENNPSEKAKTVLAIMINFLYGGPHLVFKIHPVNKLDSDFQKEKILKVIDELEQANICIKGIILDNNRVNQKCFKDMSDDLSKPYIMSRKGKKCYLFKDPTHILKTLRNNWYTEPTKELEFQLPDEKITRTAKWHYLEELFKKSEGDIIKNHNLTYVSIHPKPIERQNVKYVLKVFSDKTISALRITFGDEAEDTILFIQFVLKWWLVVNNKDRYAHIKLKDERRMSLETDLNTKHNIKIVLT